MPDYDAAQAVPLDSIEEQDKYLIRSKLEITRVLNDLAKKPDIITAYFNHGKEYLLTAVISALPDRNLLVLDYGPDEHVNERALAADRVVCVTKHDNISIKFACRGLKRARFQGDKVFAAPIPESLFRLQRREFFRVKTPTVNPIICRIPVDDEQVLELPLVDISCGGIGMKDPGHRLDVEIRDILPGCAIELPDFGTLEVDLQVRNIANTPEKGNSDARRLGCAFLNLPLDRNVVVQRFINKVEVEQRALARDD